MTNTVGSLILQAIGSLERRRLADSQNDVARQAGIAHSTLSNIINGKKRATTETLRKLAPVLRIDLRELLDALAHDAQCDADAEASYDRRAELLLRSTPAEELERIIEQIRNEAPNDPALTRQLRTWLSRRR